ncbi:MAG: hypothetical protein EOR12_16710 [Mesorhizobium sp.]|uniref:hypothetical protein n=1 Tax=Mesorhizobium sp. TaxID=1871066 RepID=UPI000FE57C6C|nr:hypothetical protein [Mesorhizobium sp.]RWP88352.1 MAG: hypothetical protein EOR12_16710 [Mesorhizobium sp.]
MKRYKLSVTTDGAGNAVAYSPRLSGEIHEIEYIKDGGANPFANGVDFTITSEATGKTLWAEADVNASASRAPRVATHSTAGVAALYAAAGTGVLARPGVANDRVKISIAQGGATKVGAFHVLVD